MNFKQSNPEGPPILCPSLIPQSHISPSLLDQLLILSTALSSNFSNYITLNQQISIKEATGVANSQTVYITFPILKKKKNTIVHKQYVSLPGSYPKCYFNFRTFFHARFCVLSRVWTIHLSCLQVEFQPQLQETPLPSNLPLTGWATQQLENWMGVAKGKHKRWIQSN